MTPADDAPAVGTKGHAGDPVRVPGEGEGFLAGVRVPHPHRPVNAAAGAAPAVGAQGHAEAPARVSLQGQDFLARVRVPDLHRPVATAADDALTVGAYGHAADLLRVPAKRALVGPEKREEVIVLPAAKVRAARCQ